MNDEQGRDEQAGGEGQSLAATAGPATEAEPVATGATPESELKGTTGRHVGGKELALALLFLVPALVSLGVWVVYPVFFTIWRSLFNAAGDTFTGLHNYKEMFQRHETRTAIKNNVIWVVTAPTIAAAIGLVFAVLTERIKFGTAFKILVFMPMAISFLASGVIFRLVYEQSPDRGLLNAIVTTVADVWQSPGPYPGARPRDLGVTGKSFTSKTAYRTGTQVLIPVVALKPDQVPDKAKPAATPSSPAQDAISGTVWLDFTRGGTGTAGTVDSTELGLPGMKVEALDPNGKVAASSKADDVGRFDLTGLDPGSYRLRLAASNFKEPWTGYTWLGPSLVTPAVIGAFLWIWTGFAMVVIAAGLAAIPRETMEAARVDGANEWQVFRRVTVPLLWPVLLVVVVTLIINVLKIFDLVLVIPPGSVQDNANVIALELWRVSFGGARDQGLGSALGVLLFALVVPAMAFNIRRFRGEQS